MRREMRRGFSAGRGVSSLGSRVGGSMAASTPGIGAEVRVGSAAGSFTNVSSSDWDSTGVGSDAGENWGMSERHSTPVHTTHFF